MARKTTTISITDAGRDQGKTYVITEMPATQAEKWAARAFLALAQSGVDVPDDVAQAGLAGIAAISLRAFAGVPWHLAEPLLDEMMRCITFMPDPARPMVVRPLIEDDIEEIVTRVRLREAIISLHIDFSIAGFISRQKSATPTADNTSNMSTFPG